MRISKEELKIKMMAKAEAAIERVLTEKKAPEEITLTEIEQLALQAGAEVQQEVTNALVEESKDQIKIPEPICPECGEPMRYKDHKTKWIVTESGEVEIERAYYYCKACKRGLFPPG